MEFGTLIAVGIWFYSIATKRYLYLLRNDRKNTGAWGLPGGKSQARETLLDTIKRECYEEINHWPANAKLIPIEKFTSPDESFSYHTFFCAVPDEFVPRLNQEHQGWAWVDAATSPKPLHPGLWNTLNFEEIQQKLVILQSQFYTSQ